MPITHPFSSTYGAAGDTTQVDGPDWNAAHNAPHFCAAFIASSTAPSWTNMPAALTELGGNTFYRCVLDLTYASEARISVVITIAGATNAEIRFQYSTDSGSSWFYLDGVSGPAVNISSTGLKVSSWITLAAGAKANVWIRPVGINGDGVADPGYASLMLQYR